MNPCSDSHRPAIRWVALTVATLLTACTGGTQWGATPRTIDIQVPVPDLTRAGQVFDGASGSTAGAQRVAERVRAALAPDARFGSVAVEGLEGGLIVLSGRVASAGDRNLAVSTARQVAGVREVVDRLTQP